MPEIVQTNRRAEPDLRRHPLEALAEVVWVHRGTITSIAYEIEVLPCRPGCKTTLQLILTVPLKPMNDVWEQRDRSERLLALGWQKPRLVDVATVFVLPDREPVQAATVTMRRFSNSTSLQ